MAGAVDDVSVDLEVQPFRCDAWGLPGAYWSLYEREGGRDTAGVCDGEGAVFGLAPAGFAEPDAFEACWIFVGIPVRTC